MAASFQDIPDRGVERLETDRMKCFELAFAAGPVHEQELGGSPELRRGLRIDRLHAVRHKNDDVLDRLPEGVRLRYKHIAAEERRVDVRRWRVSILEERCDRFRERVDARRSVGVPGLL